MSIIEIADKSITVGIYTFFVSGRRIIVASKGNKDEEELRAITEAYEKYKYRYKYAGRPLNGEFRWCMNPECNNAFYALRFKIEQGQASFCCRRCSSKVTGCPKGQQIGKSVNEPDRLAKILGLDLHDIKKAWERVALGKERQRESKLTRVEVLVFLLNELRSAEVDYLTASSADNLCYRRLGQNGPHPASFYRYLDFLVKKMPGEIMVDTASWPRRYFASICSKEKIAKIEAERDERRRERIKGKEKTPVVASPSVVMEAIEPESNLLKPRKTQLQCSRCKATRDTIVGNPSVCPACGEASVFIVVEAPA